MFIEYPQCVNHCPEATARDTTDTVSVLIYLIQLLLQWPVCLGSSQLEPQELVGGCFALLEEPWNKQVVPIGAWI